MSFASVYLTVKWTTGGPISRSSFHSHQESSHLSLPPSRCMPFQRAWVLSGNPRCLKPPSQSEGIHNTCQYNMAFSIRLLPLTSTFPGWRWDPNRPLNQIMTIHFLLRYTDKPNNFSNRQQQGSSRGRTDAHWARRQSFRPNKQQADWKHNLEPHVKNY